MTERIESEGERFDPAVDLARQVEQANRKAAQEANMGKAAGLLGRLASVPAARSARWSIMLLALVCATVGSVVVACAAVGALTFLKDAPGVVTIATGALVSISNMGMAVGGFKAGQRLAQIGKQEQQ